MAATTILTGSEKQIAWAEPIRAKALIGCERIGQRLQSRGLAGAEADFAVRVIAEIEAVQGEARAAWWIDGFGQSSVPAVPLAFAVLRSRLMPSKFNAAGEPLAEDEADDLIDEFDRLWDATVGETMDYRG